jgi:hypothetical protein
MIARTVHKHTPEEQLKKEYFIVYKIQKKNLDKNITLLDIDKIPCYA